MTTTAKIIIAIIVIVLIGWGIRSLNTGKEPSTTVVVPPVSESTTPTTVSYFCTEGSFKATYADKQVSLALPSGTVILPQVMSGSGIRYEGNGFVFVSKGDNASLEEGTKATYTNCIAGTDVQNGVMQTFTDGAKTFSFTHPSAYPVYGGEIGFSQNWRNNTPSMGLLLAKVTIPRSVQPKTNFSEATFSVGTSSDPSAIKDCLVATNGETAKGDVTINGVTYKKFELGDAAAGNLYDTTSYRTMHHAQCYAVEYTIHSTNIYNYPPELGVKAYDKAAITTTLEAVVQSFRFLPATD